MSATRRSFPLSLLAGSVCRPAMRAGLLLHAAAIVAAIGVSACAMSADDSDEITDSDDDAVAAVVPAAAQGQHVYDHVVVVIMENESSTQIFNSSSTPYIHSLAKQGVRFTNAHAVTHPSEPNYIALFSGSKQGVTDDSCPNNFTAKANLASQLIKSGRTFKGYSESMPSNGYTGCGGYPYARKHNPWVMFDNVPASSNLTFAAFPSNYSSLPTVSFVVPNLCNDMHDCSFKTGDDWLKAHMDGYAQWAKSHNSLLILTWDEDDGGHNNLIPAVFVGADITPNTTNSQFYNHYGLLRTLEDMYGLQPLNNAAAATPIAGW